MASLANMSVSSNLQSIGVARKHSEKRTARVVGSWVIIDLVSLVPTAFKIADFAGPVHAQSDRYD